MSDSSKYWVVIPAAGVGKRMGVDKPKQYISVNGKTIIEHTIDCFINREEIEAVVVAISKADEYWPDLEIAKHEKVIAAPGGVERYQSVFNGLQVLQDKAKKNDWILVHDAARPCLNQSAIDRLIINLRTHDVGGILAMPCRDTMKRANESGVIVDTVERESLWHAQTPQMFKYGKLFSAIEKILDGDIVITDEAMAMELAGYNPMLVQGHQENIKITHKDDLQYLEHFLNEMT
ncbi:MAG: 2-C-methyl-D-erythritol 4-phosphate cytidylyltransferase [Proteobacteria bacterium]|nr:2-C-methyl-D-erythritol 4-phosphate cytidylyltransferase [Pseudomonadota bacterium]NOG61284.1 2-C-methyl-D-erythritol 4-phosphate cytidylyltransferase [Pseudomonadota bacterium]